MGILLCGYNREGLLFYLLPYLVQRLVCYLTFYVIPHAMRGSLTPFVSMVILRTSYRVVAVLSSLLLAFNARPIKRKLQGILATLSYTH